ncbi:MAG: hypothetical protein LBD47_02240 [Treponema sp.]|jgi:glutamate racemase|nr:hypothetical protein [Treponema sp.]
MDTWPVLFLDSGIGAIPCCRHFHESNPGEPVVYLADWLHFPCGSRQGPELVSILISLMEKIILRLDPKIAAPACNTATVSALAEPRRRFSALPFVGTVPAVKPAALASQCRSGCEIHGIAAPEASWRRWAECPGFRLSLMAEA